MRDLEERSTSSWVMGLVGSGSAARSRGRGTSAPRRAGRPAVAGAARQGGPRSAAGATARARSSRPCSSRPARRPDASLSRPDRIPPLPSLRMHRWSEAAARIAATSRTSEKVGTLAEYLRALHAAELPLAVRYLTGRPFPERDPRTTGIGWAAIAAAAQELVGARAGRARRCVQRVVRPGPGGRRPVRRRTSTSTCGDPPSLPEVDAAFSAIAAARGPAAKGAALRALLARCDRAVRPSRWSRCSPAICASACARAISRRPSPRPSTSHWRTCRWAGMLTGDIGHTAELARDDALGARRAGAVPAAEVDARVAGRGRGRGAQAAAAAGLGRGQVRRHPRPAAQAGRRGAAVTAATCTTSATAIPEVVASGQGQPWDGILDGEVLALRDGMALPFIQLQRASAARPRQRRCRRRCPSSTSRSTCSRSAPGGGARVEPLCACRCASAARGSTRCGLPDVPGMATGNL